jgi:hypothetical protein
VIRHACKMGLEGIVSKRRNSRIGQGVRPKDEEPREEVKREAEEGFHPPQH